MSTTAKDGEPRRRRLAVAADPPPLPRAHHLAIHSSKEQNKANRFIKKWRNKQAGNKSMESVGKNREKKPT
jgi:hypothetical protein